MGFERGMGRRRRRRRTIVEGSGKVVMGSFVIDLLFC